MTTPQSAELLRATNAHRLRFAAFSDRNPAMAPVKPLADYVRAHREPVSPANPLLTLEKVTSTWISTCLESYRLARDAMTEAMFLGTYGSPGLQAAVGLAAGTAPARRQIGRDLAREVIAGRWRAELETRFEVGGLPEAVVRALMHVRLPSRTVDERGFAVLQAVRQILPANRRIGFDELKQLFRDQYLLVRLDEERAIRAIPKLLPDDPELRAAAWQVVQDILSASGSLTPEEQSLMQRLEPMFVGARTLPQENQDA